jgi:hypothetical protein
MIFNIQHTANWEYIKKRKQCTIDLNNKRENSKRQQHVYRVGDKVLLNRGTENKYESPYIGPLDIMKSVIKIESLKGLNQLKSRTKKYYN